MISFRNANAADGLAPHVHNLELFRSNVHNTLRVTFKAGKAVWRDSRQYRVRRAIASSLPLEPSLPRAEHFSRASASASSSGVDVAEHSLVTSEDVNGKLEAHIINPKEVSSNMSVIAGSGEVEENFKISSLEDSSAETKKLLPYEESQKVEDLNDQQDQLLSEVWRKIQGDDNWEHLLNHPIDPILRSELLRYGEFAQICYDAFDFDRYSLYCGNSKYVREKLFEKVEKGCCGYEVTKYLYATSNLDLPKFFRKSHMEKLRWSGDSNWMGYVAVATDKKEIERLGRRDIIVAWRGTATKTEWVSDLMDVQSPARLEEKRLTPDVKVEAGFLELYTARKPKSRFNKQSAREQVLSEVRRLLKQYEAEEMSVTVTGHSLGGALALLSAYDLAAEVGGDGRRKSEPPVTVFSFSAPRVGNRAFKRRMEELGVKVLRVVNVHDKVPRVPGLFWNEGWAAAVGGWLSDAMEVSWGWAYHHIGAELRLDTTTSPLLRVTEDASCHHNLEALLHILDGYHGSGRPFSSVTGRSYALVNKDSDFLRWDTFIPAFWRQDMNKGLIKNSRGHWVLAPRDHQDSPP